MFNVCPQCGEYVVEKSIDPAGPFAVCPNCGHKHPFAQLPLFILSGASGTGKTTLCLELAPRLTGFVFLEMDILWQAEFNKPEDDYADFRNMWLRLAKNIGQAGRPVVLCGSATPGQFERQPECRYFTALHYLALVCQPDVLQARLQARPGWRQAAHDAFIQSMIGYNQWFCDHAGQFDPLLATLDTTDLAVAETAAQVIDWLQGRLKPV